MLSFEAPFSWFASLTPPVHAFRVTFYARFEALESFTVQVEATSYVEAALQAFATQPLLVQSVESVHVTLCESCSALLVAFAQCWVSDEGVLHAPYIHQFGVPVLGPDQAAQLHYDVATSSCRERFY